MTPEKCAATVMIATSLLFLATYRDAAGSGDKRPLHCGDAYAQYEKYWKYDAEEAYAFGQKIKDTVRQRDLVAFFSLVDGELDNGPRRIYIDNKSFSDIFPESWRAKILKSEPECTPVGWRGFMLAHGLIWYRSSPFRIIAVNGWVKEKFPPVPVGWKVDGKILSPRCFAYEWSSSDNFEEFQEQFGIRDFRDFRHNTGKYFGDPIYPFEPILFYGERISLWRNVIDCAVDVDGLLIEDKMVKFPPNGDEPWRKYEYGLLSEISNNLCRELAPNLPGKCVKSYLVGIFRPGGSMSFVSLYIYGLFELGDGGKIVFPLKYFDTLNSARNFLDN